MGNGYDFTLFDVGAQDLLKEFLSVYVNPLRFTFQVGFANMWDIATKPKETSLLMRNKLFTT